ncbi:MAG: hypothetical protein K8T20_13700, partial [Planctomycetes bacterium]|nr:hypothetical protein [Planctomycetota bacterium]
MIELSCSCGKKINVPDTLAGKKGKCPGCGSVIEVPAAPPPPPAKKDELELELDDDRKPTAKPIEALIPPVQELPSDGKPKKKVARIASDDLMGDEPPKHASSRAPRPVGAVGTQDEGKVPCPQCGQMYAADILFCMKCSVDIATGKPISGVLPGKRAKKAADFDPDLPFWQITLRMFYKPIITIQYFSSWFERKDVKLQMFGVYLLSLIVVAIAASGRSHREEARIIKGPNPEEKIAKIESDAGAYKPHIFESWTKSGEQGLIANDAKPYVFRVNSPKEEVEAGAAFTVKFAFCEPGPGKGIEGDAWIVPTESWKGPAQKFADWVQAKTSGQPGDYLADLDARTAEGSSFAIMLYAKGADPGTPGVTPRSTVHVAWASKAGWGRKRYAELAGTEAEKKQRVTEQAARLERRKGKLFAPSDWQRAFDAPTGRVGQIGDFLWKMENPQGDVEAGKKFMVTLQMAMETDKQPGEAVEADVYPTLSGGGWGDAETEAGTSVPVKMQEISSGKYQIELTALSSQATVVNFAFCPKGQPLTAANRQGSITVSFPTRGGWAKPIVEKEQAAFEKANEANKPSTQKGTQKKVLLGGSAVIGSILANILGLIVTVGICFLGAKLFAGGANILLMFASFAYITGFANLLDLTVFVMPPSVGNWGQVALAVAQRQE